MTCGTNRANRADEPDATPAVNQREWPRRMIDSRRDRDPVELLADEYASRCRAGETPSIAEYVDKYPLFADQIRLLFPAVEMMERFRVNEQAREHGKHQRFSSLAVPSSLGDFTIVREIGRGGMGVVYEAEQQSLARRVAVKVLPKQMLLSDELLRQFQREAQTAARLHHTNIVPVFGIGEQDGLHYYVMPLIRGVGLDELIRHMRGVGEMETRHWRAGGRGGGEDGMRAAVRDLVAKKFPSTTGREVSGAWGMGWPAGDHPVGHGGAVAGDRWRMTANVGLQAAVALEYAHGQGTLHRDIKPSNLLVDERGLVLVADFGLARAVDLADASRGDDVVGTWRYMAPEQFEGDADPRSDIYALGLTLYELLVLQPAFRGADGARRVPGRRSDPEPVWPRDIDPSVPRDLETVILKCVAAEPARRYERAAALADDLQRLLDGRPIRARRVSLPERAWRWCRRSPALAIVSALAALSLLAAAATAIVGYVETSRAYAQTRQALARTEATSRLSLQVLDDIYLQLSPDRIWVLSDVGAGGEACACLGLRTGAGAAILGQRHAMQVRLSEETASLLNGLLIFYDRLAEQSGDDSHVKLQSAIARRRIGDIRQRLGQLALAETEYAKAIRHLRDLSELSAVDAEVARELARTCNELGNIQTAQLEHARARESHWNAMRALQSCQAVIATS
ncbi:MAG: serine/threonine protein kinase, partial [Planctomycetes bacterium]|nr:serine/threonine protein kinase [Planctomycetota bacterium]